MPANFEFWIGLTVGKILLGALFASNLFRNLAFAGAGVCVVALYYKGGIAALIFAAQSNYLDFLSRPDFMKGLAVGAGIAALAVGLFRLRSV